jgi:hypothetical protein
MNRDDIIAMAREAGCIPRRHPEHWDDVQVFATPDVLERFAALVAAAERKRLEATAWGASQKWIERAIEAEREACAKLCDEYVVPVSIAGAHPDYLIGKQMAFQQVARAIRDRGEK